MEAHPAAYDIKLARARDQSARRIKVEPSSRPKCKDEHGARRMWRHMQHLVLTLAAAAALAAALAAAAAALAGAGPLSQ